MSLLGRKSRRHAGKGKKTERTSIYEHNERPKRSIARKHEKIEGEDTFTGDSIFDKAVARRVIGLKVKVSHVKGPKTVENMHEHGEIHSTYRGYVAKDEVYDNLSKKQKKQIEKADAAIDRYYANADRKREKELGRGKLPKHRSINKHYNKNVKKDKFTPNAKVAKEEKIKLERKLGFKIEGELDTVDDRIKPELPAKKKKKFLL